MSVTIDSRLLAIALGVVRLVQRLSGINSENCCLNGSTTGCQLALSLAMPANSSTGGESMDAACPGGVMQVVQGDTVDSDHRH